MLFCLAIIAVLSIPVLYSIFPVFVSPGARRWFQLLYIALGLACVIASSFSTFGYEYRPNPNTIVYGWPIPRVVFQRDTPDGPFWDFVGPTAILALPMNFLLFFFLPALISALLVHFNRAVRRPKITAA